VKPAATLEAIRNAPYARTKTTSRPSVAVTMPAQKPSMPVSMNRSVAATSRAAQKSVPLRPSKLTAATSATTKATSPGCCSTRVTPINGARQPTVRRPSWSRTSHGESFAISPV
jgi:hypothetical protein